MFDNLNLVGQAMNSIAIAVVGHTNVGKTSLLRTLLRDATFGDVSPLPSTTIQVNSGSLRWESNQLDLFDTPGLEDGMGLYEYLQYLLQREQIRHQGPALLQSFLNSPEADQSFAQEAKVIRQLLRSDAALYVVDVRDPVLPKFQDELAILSYGGKPILPILNFTASADTHKAAWHNALSEVNLHVWVEFDSVTPPQNRGNSNLSKSGNLVAKSSHSLAASRKRIGRPTCTASARRESNDRRDLGRYCCIQSVCD